jgi:hypothetical protein
MRVLLMPAARSATTSAASLPPRTVYQKKIKVLVKGGAKVMDN